MEGGLRGRRAHSSLTFLSPGMTLDQANAAGTVAQTVETEKHQHVPCNRKQLFLCHSDSADFTHSPSPGSARTVLQGWSRSAKASKPCSLECLHLPAFSSYHLWAVRAWAGASAEEQGSYSEPSPPPLPPAAEVRAGHAENHSEPTLPSGTSSLTEAPGPGGIRVQQVSGHLHSGSLLAGGSIWSSSTSELMPTSHIASTPSFASYLLLKLFLI